MAASLNDSNVLGANSAFIGRVEAALASACVAIFNEGLSVNNHRDRVNLIHQVFTNPTTMLAWATVFAIAVSTDSNVLSDATVAGTVALTGANIVAQQALVTDAHINTAVSSMFNAFVPGISA